MTGLFEKTKTKEKRGGGCQNPTDTTRRLLLLYIISVVKNHEL